MRLMKLTSGAAVLGMSAGLGLVAGGATAASAASTTIRPYVFNVIAVGQTDPGVWDNEACLIAADGSNPGDNGKINGTVVAGHSGELNVTYTGITSSLPVSTCVPVDINVSGSTTTTPGTKPGGTFAVTTQSDVQGGIEASSVVTVDVTYSAGQTIKAPGSVTLVSGTVDNPSGDTARFAFKPAKVKTKAVLNSSCADKIYVVDTNTHDGTKTNAPVSTEWDGSTALTSGQYMATLRGCALDPANVPGKPVTTKIKVVGDGAVSASFVQAATVDPATWDTTRGKTCKAMKTVATSGFGTQPIDASRVLQCKGDYGVSVAFSLNVRGWTTNGGEDPNGLNNPAAPLLLGSGTFTN